MHLALYIYRFSSYLGAFLALVLVYAWLPEFFDFVGLRSIFGLASVSKVLFFWVCLGLFVVLQVLFLGLRLSLSIGGKLFAFKGLTLGLEANMNWFFAFLISYLGAWGMQSYVLLARLGFLLYLPALGVLGCAGGLVYKSFRINKINHCA